MKTRDVYLLNGYAVKDSDTVTVDLTKGMKVLYFIIRYSNTNGGTSNTVGRLNGMVSKLALIDGSDVKHSLSMREEQAKNFFDYRRLPYQLLDQSAGGTVTEEAVMDFRRFPADQNFYLDTSLFNNPQLLLTNAFTVSATAGFVTGDGTVTVIARVIDSGAQPNQGFVMAKELDSFASAASGDHTTDLPLDYPIESVMVLDPVDGEPPDHYLSNFKLTADVDSFIPVDMAYADLLQKNFDQFGQGIQDQIMLAGTSGTIDGDLYAFTNAWITKQANATGYLSDIAGNEITAAAGTSEALTARLSGSAPHAAAIYRFGDGVDPSNVFDPTGVGKFQLKLTNAATGATPKVVTIQQHS